MLAGRMIRQLVVAVIVSWVGSTAEALPMWARVIGESRCEYLAMGASWKEASSQSYADNQIWKEQVELAHSNGLAAKAIIQATLDFCPDLAEPILFNPDGSWKPSSEVYAD